MPLRGMTKGAQSGINGLAISTPMPLRGMTGSADHVFFCSIISTPMPLRGMTEWMETLGKLHRFLLPCPCGA